METINKYNNFENSTFLHVLIEEQIKCIQEIKKIRCIGDINKAIDILNTALRINDLGYYEYKNIQNKLSEVIYYLKEIYTIDEDEINNALKTNEDNKKVLNDYFISVLKILYYTGIIELKNPSILQSLDQFYQGYNYYNWTGLNLKQIVYTNPCELLLAIENLSSGIHNQLYFNKNLYMKKFRHSQFSKLGVFHSRYLVSKKSGMTLKMYPFFVDVITSPKIEFVTITLGMNIDYLIDQDLFRSNDDFIELGKCFCDKYIGEYFYDIKNAFYTERGIDLLFDILIQQPILKMSCINISELNEALLNEQIKKYLELLEKLSPIDNDEINDLYLSLRKDEPIKPQYLENINNKDKIKYLENKVKISKRFDYIPVKNQLLIENVQKSISPIEKIICAISELEQALLGCIKNYKGSIVRQDYSSIIKYVGGHIIKKEIVLTPYLYLHSEPVTICGTFLDKKKAELPDLNNMLINTIDIFELKDKYVYDEIIFEKVIDFFVDGFNKNIVKGTFEYKPFSNLLPGVTESVYHKLIDELLTKIQFSVKK